MKKIGIITLMAIVIAGCDKQRDLYVTAGPMIYAEGDWLPSLGRSDMFMDATAVAYNADGLFAKEYFFNPDNVIILTDRGTYDVMIFNGLMYSEQDTHLDNIFFRGTEDINTFEAVAREAAPNIRLGRKGDEYIASNEMELITSATQRQQIESTHSYYIRYKDGESVSSVPVNYIEAELYMTPQAMSYEARVTVTLKNISSAYAANAALYGFVGSAFMASRKPSNFYVTHQFNLNNKEMISEADDIGTIRSPSFVTFGPPVDAPANEYKIYVKITLVDGTLFEETVDVAEQVLPVIAAIQDNLNGVEPIQYMLTIPLNIEFELPVVEPSEGGIGLGDWGDDEIIKFPVT